MKVIRSEIPDVVFIEPRVFPDSRGSFRTTFRVDEYAAAGLTVDFKQDNVSVSRAGVLRGLHFQHPNGQAKLVYALRGKIFDVAVDVRADSPTFGRAVWTWLSDENHRQALIPAGFAHGFFVESDEAVVVYKCSELYAPESEHTIRWDDPALGIPWPGSNPVMSERDAAAPLLRELFARRVAVILVLGGSGQIGHELVRELSVLAKVTAPTTAELDLASPDAIRDFVRARRPLLIVNAAAYTAVDAAESDADRCAAINTRAAGVLAEVADQNGAYFVHFSTDYVFDGTRQTPYVETDETNPLGVYGRTKRDGERAVVANGKRYLIFRTGWVYSTRGKNFVLTMRRLAREREVLSVVNDQIGAPTSAAAIAAGVVRVLRVLQRQPELATSVSGIYHMTAGGSTTWYDFARAIIADDPRRDEHVCRVIRPITTADYPTPAKRPAYSVLDNTKLTEVFGVRLPSWEEQWQAFNAPTQSS